MKKIKPKCTIYDLHVYRIKGDLDHPLKKMLYK